MRLAIFAASKSSMPISPPSSWSACSSAVSSIFSSAAVFPDWDECAARLLSVYARAVAVA